MFKASVFLGVIIIFVFHGLSDLSAYGQRMGNPEKTKLLPTVAATQVNDLSQGGNEGNAVSEKQLQDFEKKIDQIDTRLTEEAQKLRHSLATVNARSEENKELLMIVKQTLEQGYDFSTRELIMLGSLLVALMTFGIGTISQLKYKRADTALEFFKRFHETVKDRADTSKADLGKNITTLSGLTERIADVFSGKERSSATLNDDIDDYLYWSIQHQQFTSWRRGLLPHKTYQFWLARRIMEHSTERQSGGLCGWDKQKEKFYGSNFYDFMELILGFADPNNRRIINGNAQPLSMSDALEYSGGIMWEFVSCGVRLRRFFLKRYFPEGVLAKFGKKIGCRKH